METVCRPGDLAIVISAQNTSNIGLIVRVLHRNSGRGNLAMKKVGPLWTCECARPMMLTMHDKVFLRKRGPVPDSYMRPIRGERPPLATVGARVALETA